MEGRISRRIHLCVAATASALAVAAAPAMAAEGSLEPGFTVYAGCGTTPTTPPSHFCHHKEPLGAFFKSDVGGVVYDLCVELPIRLRQCYRHQSASNGVLYVNNVDFGVRGPTTLVWNAGSKTVGVWKIDVYPDPVVPKFGISPLIVSRTHRLFGLVLRHVPEDSRVRAWRKCDGSCPLPLRLSSSRGETRRYEIVGSRTDTTFSLGETLYVQVDAPGKLENDNRVWGRLYRGKLVRDRRGGPADTAILRIGDLLCTPPGKTFRAATTCNEVKG